MSEGPQTIRIELAQAPTAPAPESTKKGFWTKLETLIGLVAKLLPGVALLLAVFLFRQEISDFLRNASKVEAFGFKLEKGEFEKRLQASAESLKISKDNLGWTEAPFRKLRLAAPLLKNFRILWVDDHPENNFFLRRILGDLGVEVTVTLNNREALDAIKRKDFQIIISDFNRDSPPTETGGDLALAARALSYEAPVLFYTSSPDQIPTSVPRALATNDPAALLSMIAELAITQAK